MKKNTLLALLVIVLMVGSCNEQSIEGTDLQVPNTDPLTRTEINDFIIKKLNETNDVFHWTYADDHMLWSAVVQSDSLVTIGYKPAGLDRIDDIIHQISLNDDAWKTARNKILDYVVTETNRKYGQNYTAEELMPYGLQETLPYIDIRLYDQEMITAIRSMPEVRYLEPSGYSMEEVNFRSDSGCGSYDANVNSGDYQDISPTSRRSWHHFNANVDDAWNNSSKGDNIWVALIDTGVSKDQDKLNGEFSEGESTSRTIQKYGFHKSGWWWNKKYDGWHDQCGHGTAMAGLIAAPRGTDRTPAGVAYRANLISYRGTSDVIINSSDEKNGVSESLIHAANQSKVKIISMSIGDVISSGKVSDAVKYAYNKGKLMFAAAGTSLTWTSWWGVIFPASMNETVAVTGIKTGSPREKCSTCHDGDKVDFVLEMQRRSDNDRTAVSLTLSGNDSGYVGGSSAATASMAGIAALVWGDHPSWSRTQVLNELKVSADTYPSRSSNFGWGKVDANAAVQ
jgi:subtilisin family serine protease